MNKHVATLVAHLTHWVQTNVLTWETASQWVCVAISFFLALLIWRVLSRHISRWMETHVPGAMLRSLLLALMGIGSMVVLIILMQICAAVFLGLHLQPGVLQAASHLTVAWIVIRLLTGMMSSRAMAKGVAVLIWLIAALRIFNMLDPITKFLESLSFSMGGISFNSLGVIKGLGLAAICLQAASIISKFVTQRIETIEGLSPSLRVLLVKGMKTVLFTMAILFAMSSVGIDLTSLAIFSSALGVGIGFGLKTIFSNFVAGVLLLMDNSIKPGDTIEVGGVFGQVRGMYGRYTSILTRDGKEYLIPNELLVTGEVVNWTYSDSNVRIHIPVGISYDSDVEKALALLLKAGDGVKRVLKRPASVAHIMGFGDSSVDLQLRVWIADADKGISNVRGEVLHNIWKLFHENGIQFPFPQRDVLLKQDSVLSVKLQKEDADE